MYRPRKENSVYRPRKENSVSFETTTHAICRTFSATSAAFGDLAVVLDAHHEVLPVVGGLLVDEVRRRPIGLFLRENRHFYAKIGLGNLCKMPPLVSGDLAVP